MMFLHTAATNPYRYKNISIITALPKKEQLNLIQLCKFVKRTPGVEMEFYLSQKLKCVLYYSII